MNSIDRINRIYKIHFGEATMLSYPVLTIQEGRNAVDRINRSYRVHSIGTRRCFHLVKPVNPGDFSSTLHMAEQHIDDNEDYNRR